MRYSSLFVLLVFIHFWADAQKLNKQDIAVLTHLREHVTYLASDNLEGRRTGTMGEMQAAMYISNAFEAAGLLPKGTEGFYQPFDVQEGKEIDTATLLSINGSALERGTDFFPLAYSANGKFNGMPSIVLMEKGAPWFYNLEETLKANQTNPHFDIHEAIVAKVKEVEKGGGIALFVYNSSAFNDQLQFNGKEIVDLVSIPVVYIDSRASKKYLSDPYATMKITGNIQIKQIKRTGRNVIGYLDRGAANTIIIGAHFDHLGYGEDHNSRYTGATKEIHNGADDNASGVAALIELANLLKASKLKNSNYLFIAFSGEELGLFGSKYFTSHPTVDLTTINYMINLDMIGRLGDSSKVLTVGGFGTSPTWNDLYNRKGKSKLFNVATYRFDSSGTGPSDHTSFYTKNIPVLFYFTGLHADYHKPTDDFDKINYIAELGIVKHIYSVVQATDRLAVKLAFTKTRETQTTSTARFSVTLGIMPDYTFTGAGIRVDGVSENRPAQKAGLQAGDVITVLGDYKVSNLENYMQTLGKFKKGDKTAINYIRNGQSIVATVEF